MTDNNRIENLLRDRMNKLSDSVDCLDNITSRVFPENTTDSEEDGYTVSALENVTGKARRINIIKWTSAIAAAVVAVAVIPRTGIVQRILSDTSKGSEIFDELINEINTLDGSYITADYPLDYYISHSALITPLFSCPFENTGKEDVNVRIFIRQIAGIDTNQVYAVEYQGEYSEENIFAAAESYGKFTAEDRATLVDFDSGIFQRTSQSADYIAGLFDTNDDGLFINEDGVAVSLASFQYCTFIKSAENGILSAVSEVLYYHETLDDDGYFYDILSLDGYDESVYMQDWQKSVYFNGNSALPGAYIGMTRTELFTQPVEDENLSVIPADFTHWGKYGEKITASESSFGKRLAYITPSLASDTTSVYVSANAFDSSESSSTITIKSDQRSDVDSYDFEQEFMNRLKEDLSDTDVRYISEESDWELENATAPDIEY